MSSTPRRASLFALYQLSVLLGIALLPLAVLTRRAGVTLPVGRAVTRLGDAYEEAAE